MTDPGPRRPYNILIVAGEASGDMHGARLVRALRELAEGPEPVFFGAAGPSLRSQGVDAVVRSDDLSVIGLPEIARALPMFLRAFGALRRAAVERPADVAVLIDFPEFNLKLAGALKKRGIPVVYYISPQLWAWRGYRIRSIRRSVDRLLTILPFEKPWYESRGVTHVEYVGNPTVREVHPTGSREDFCRRHGLDPGRPIVALLGGSRHKEIVRILPELFRTAALMAGERPELQFVNAMAPNRSAEEVRDAITAAGVRVPDALVTVFGETYDALAAADAAAVTSGTATLETGLLGTPLAIVYKASRLNYGLVRPLISVEHFGLINLVAGRRLAAEFIQDDFTPEALAAEMFRLLDPAVNISFRGQLAEVRESLGEGGASRRAAAAVLDVLNRYGTRRPDGA